MANDLKDKSFTKTTNFVSRDTKWFVLTTLSKDKGSLEVNKTISFTNTEDLDDDIIKGLASNELTLVEA